MSKKKVSIIVPVYKTEKFLDKCLTSLVNQTLKDIEIVIVNDGSPDNSEEIIKRFEKKYKDIIKYVKIPNGGVANARNVGLDNATGEYIGFVDSDDYIEENTYELLYSKAKDTKSEMVVSGYFSEDEDGNISNNGLDDLSEYGKSLEENPGILLVINPFITSKLYSKKMLDKYNIRFNKKYRIFEDLLFCYSALLMANKIEKVNKALYHYIRRKNESVTGQLNPKFYDLYPVMNDLRDFYEKNSDVDFTEYLTYVAIHHSHLRFTPSVGFKKLFLKYRYIRDTYKFLDGFNPNWNKNIYYSIKKRKGKIYKTKWFWFLVPTAKKVKNILIKIVKKTIRNYGRTLIKYSKKPIIENAMFFESQKGNDINGNMFYLIRSVRRNSDYDNYMINVAVSKNRIEEFKKKLAFYNITNYNLVVMNSKEYINHLARDKYLFTDTSFPIYFKKRKEQVYLNTWHGTPLKYLGRSVAYDYYNISNVMNNFFNANYILYPNNFMKDAMVEDYMLNIRNNKILMLGYPRNSVFFEESKTTKQRIAYLPTWRGTMTNIGGNSYVNELADILKELDSLLTDEQEFYINLHPFLKGKLDVSKYDKIKLVPKEYETYDFLNTCDVLVTDYSSVFFDYANTKKNIILFTYDKEAYLKDRGMYLDIDDLPFKKVYTVKELVKEINNKKSIKYDKFIKEYCYYDSIDVPEKIIDLMVNNNEKGLTLIPNSNNKEAVLIESNNYLKYDIYKELANYLKNINEKNTKNIYLGFSNGSLKKNKEFLNEFGRKIDYYGYYGNFELVSFFEVILLNLLKRKPGLYKKFKKKYDFIFMNELERRYGSVCFKDIVLYKEKDLLKIYLYSFLDINKVIVLDKIPNINFDILDKYDKIVVENDKDRIYLSKYISDDKIYLKDKFNLDKFL